MNRTLLTFVGFHDPYGDSPIEGARSGGPILQVLRCRPFERVVLFSTPKVQERTRRTQSEIQRFWPEMTVETKSLERLDDPTNHILILRYLRKFVRELLAERPDAQYCVSISSGTPSMHACWLLLTAEGALPARLLYGHPSRDVGVDDKISEVDLNSDEFPHIAPSRLHDPLNDNDYVPDLQAVREELQIVGDHPVFVAALEKVARLAQYKINILLVGETGTGKEEFARLFHRMSRRKGRFVPVNGGSIPEKLAESELFGHQRGAFTGADRDREGAFANAQGGTLFLDEIGNMPIEIQAKLLRVLQDGKIKPMGAKTEQATDVCVVAATNADLDAAKKDGKFRFDFEQRFKAVIELPPLRNRRSDIVKLATHALRQWNIRYGKKMRISRAALSVMQTHDWPGNVRELINAVEFVAMTCRGQTIGADDLRISSSNNGSAADSEFSVPEPREGFDSKACLDQLRDRLYRRALDKAEGNKTKAARLLGISQQAVHNYFKAKL